MTVDKIKRKIKIQHLLYGRTGITLGCATTLEAVAYLFHLNQELFEKDKVVMKEKDIDLLVASVNPTRLKNNPLELSKETIHKLYREIVGRNCNVR